MSTEKSIKEKKKRAEKKKQKIRIKRLWAALAAAALVLLPGCGQAAEESPEEKIKLRVVYSSGDIRWTGSVEWVAECFMKEHPEVEVVLEAPEDVENQSFTDRLKVLIAQEEFYDVLELREEKQFAEAGYLAPLPEELTGLIDRGKEEGQVCYAVPRYTTTQGMIYNREMFRTMGLSEPESYEEFLDVCKAIKKAGINPIAVGGANIWHMGFWGNYLYQNYLLDEEGRSDWNQERVVPMLEDFRALSKNGYIEESFKNISDSQTIQELSSGEAAMVYSGPWIIDQILGLNPYMELGFFYLPGKDGKFRAQVDDSVTWGISKECQADKKRWKAAVNFLEFFYAEGIYEHVLVQMNAEPVTVRRTMEEETPAQQMVRKARGENVMLCRQFVGDEDTPDGFRSFYDQSLREVLWGERPLEILPGN